MPQLVGLALTDRQATPVSHSFLPRDITGNVATVVESSGVPIGDNRVSLSMTKTSAGRYKPVAKFVFPVVQNAIINGISTPTVVRTAYAEVSFSFEGTSTEAERNDVVGMVQAALDKTKTLTNGVFVKLEPVY